MNKSIAVVVSALISSCAVGPDYLAPQIEHQNAFFAGQMLKTSIYAQGEEFWGGFEDPQLQQLIAGALADNPNLQAMLARYQGAEAVLRGAQRQRWPSITAYANASERDFAQVEQPSTQTEELQLFEAGSALRWEVDLFGRLAHATEARHAQLQATRAELAAMQVALVGQLAVSYFELRGLQQQLAVAQQNVALQQSSLDIITSRVAAGRGTAFDELRARAQLHITGAAIPDLQAHIKSNMHHIAVLAGATPGALNEQLAAEATSTIFARPMPAIALGTPGELLRRRPDIQAAERHVAAASARIGSATAELFPRFTLQTLVGSVAGSGGDLFTAGTGSRLVAFGIDWSFLDLAQVHARIDAADAEAAVALAQYRQTVLLALEETETWLVRYQHSQERSDMLRAAEQAASAAVAQARQRYEQGYSGFFELLTAELELAHARNAWVSSQTDAAVAMVNLYRALAGAPNTTPAATLTVAPHSWQR